MLSAIIQVPLQVGMDMKSSTFEHCPPLPNRVWGGWMDYVRVVGALNGYTKYDIQCLLAFYVTMVNFWMTLLMYKRTNIGMDDG